MKDLKRCLKVGFTCKFLENFFLSIFQSFNINFSPNILLYMPLEWKYDSTQQVSQFVAHYKIYI